MRAACLALLFALCACTQFPELDGTVSPEVEGAAYPALVPLGPLLASAVPAGSDPVQTTQNLEARITLLRARARALQRRSVLDASARARLTGGLG